MVCQQELRVGAADNGKMALNSRPREWLVSGALLLLLAAMFIASLLAGRVWLPVGEVWQGLWSPDANLAATIITQLRLPR